MMDVLNWAADHPILAVLLAIIVFGNMANVLAVVIRRR